MPSVLSVMVTGWSERLRQNQPCLPSNAATSVGVGRDAGQNTEQQRGGMADGKKRDVNSYVLQPVKKEDHAKQEQQVIVPGHHVFCPKIDKRKKEHAAAFLNVAFVTFGNVVGPGFGAARQEHQEYGQCGHILQGGVRQFWSC